jgi:DnaB-like helicase N terminal domain/AAA domain
MMTGREARSVSKQSASQVLDKPLPSNVAYEQYALGAALCACLFGDRTCEKLIEILKRDDFYLDSHKLIYDAIKQLLESNSPINEYTVYQWLRKNNPSKNWGGAVYLAELARLINKRTDDAELEYYADDIKSHAQLRRLIAYGDWIAERAYDAEDAPEIITDEAERQIIKLREQSHSAGRTKGLISLSSLPEPGPLQFTVADIIPTGYVTNLYGDGAQGKSSIALHITLSIILGRPFLNHFAMKGPVLYLDWELDAEMQRRRWGAVCRGAGLDTLPNGLEYYRMYSPLRAGIARVRALQRDVKPVLTIIDSVGKALGDNPLDPEQVIKFHTMLEDRGTVLCIDHQGRAGEGGYQSRWEFGPSYKRHLARSSWQIERVGEEGNRIGLVLRHKKTNFGASLPDIHASLTFEEDKSEPGRLLSVKLDHGDPTPAQAQFGLRSQILSALKAEPATAEELAEMINDYDGSSVRNALTALKKSRLIKPDGKKGRAALYRLSDEDHHNHLPIGSDDDDQQQSHAGAIAYCHNCGVAGLLHHHCDRCGAFLRASG